MPGGTDKRRFPRRNIALDVAFAPVPTAGGRPPDAQLAKTVTLNISVGGVCLYTDSLFPVGRQLACVISVPTRATPIEVTCTVAWFQKISQDSHSYKLGLEFADLKPADRAVIEHLVAEPPSGHATRAKRLLVVDDDVEFVQALKVRFESAGFDVLTAQEGLEALHKSRSEHPHVIILDLMLPKLNGYEVCRMLKFDQKFQHIPIILCSARSRKDDIDMGYSVGADAYITKPFEGRALVDKVDELLANAKGAA